MNLVTLMDLVTLNLGQMTRTISELATPHPTSAGGRNSRAKGITLDADLISGEKDASLNFTPSPKSRERHYFVERTEYLRFLSINKDMLQVYYKPRHL
ncbi:hypothetical protein AVEN_120104-1 [Araneus ventricosus]|uniref:Uncharacterized protein n=1 Tax=Araneus ventricosus TaxID=182803 RepID=A0A4Y2G4D6_ARAVE|nr:hypothetical protein AVEN_120104-1 [Araneus ventricosus]